MIDYLLRFADEAAAMAALPAHTVEGIEPGARLWADSYVFPDVKAFRILGTQMVENGIGGAYEDEVREYLPDYFVWIALAERDPALEGAPCVLIGDRDRDVVLHTITTPEDLATLRLEPTPAGSHYSFGAPIIAAES